MSFNKVEALREKGVAETFIRSNDYASARDKIKKAQQLFPALDHIGSMVAVCDILSASSNIIPGYDIDYYWVLQLIPSSTFMDITNQYQKLVSLLQPIKNKFPGTELALKLLHDAFSVLSDKRKRVAFDMKRGICWEDYESFAEQAPSVCNGEGIRNLESDLPAKSNNGKVCNNVSLQESGSSSSDVISEGNKGRDIDMQVDDIDSSPELPSASLKGSTSTSKDVHKKPEQDFYDFEIHRTADCFKNGQIWAVHHQLTKSPVHRYAQINEKSEFKVEVTWLKPITVGEGEKRWCDAGLPVACGSYALDLETREKVNSISIFSYNCSYVCGVTAEQYEIYPRKGEIWAIYKDWDLDEWSYHPDMIKGCTFEFVEMLSDYCKYLGVECALLVKVDGYKSIFERKKEDGNPVTLHISPRNSYMLSYKVPAYRFSEGEIDGLCYGMFELDQLALQNDVIQEMGIQAIIAKEDEVMDNIDFDIPVEESSSLKPDPGSTVLGPNWTVNDFTNGQVWAAYTGKDQMPRQYIRINNVISKTQLSVTCLEPEPSLDHEIHWKDENLPIVCGIFRAKESTIDLHISQISHLVNCQKSTTTPIYKIYPMKGEVWAIYRNWNVKWNRVNYEKHKCWIVEILSDFSGGDGMMVARLIEVKGCLTFFQKQQCEDGFDLIRAIPRKDVLCFSHQIPAFRVPGIGRHGIPENSWHLEPMALPSNHGRESDEFDKRVGVQLTGATGENARYACKKQ